MSAGGAGSGAGRHRSGRGAGPRRHAVPRGARDRGQAWSAAPSRAGVTLRALDADELTAIDARLTPAVLRALDPAAAVAARTVIGGPAPAAVRREIERLAVELTALGFAV